MKIDILKHFSNLNQNRPKLVVGFAVTEDLVRNGKAKLLDKDGIGSLQMMYQTKI